MRAPPPQCCCKVACCLVAGAIPGLPVSLSEKFPGAGMGSRGAKAHPYLPAKPLLVWVLPLSSPSLETGSLELGLQQSASSWRPWMVPLSSPVFGVGTGRSKTGVYAPLQLASCWAGVSEPQRVLASLCSLAAFLLLEQCGSVALLAPPLPTSCVICLEVSYCPSSLLQDPWGESGLRHGPPLSPDPGLWGLEGGVKHLFPSLPRP